MRWILLMLCMLGAGPTWAGAEAMDGIDGMPTPTQAWIAEYRVHDGQGDRSLIIVRAEQRVEYRLQGEPVRLWEQGADGLVHREVFLADGRVVSYTPGDLRALGRNPDWSQLNHLVAPDLRTQLTARGATKVRVAGNAQAERYRGMVQGVPVTLDWLEAAGLPAHYRSGKGKQAYELELRTLTPLPAAQAFTALESLRDIDYADIGDMEADLFARRYIREGAVLREH